jgi:hypothetical protein
VRIYCHAGQKTPIYDAGKTIAVGAFGAVVTVAAPVVVDELVLLIHPKSGRELVCRVNAVAASGSGLYEIVLEFSEEAPDFWGFELVPTPLAPLPVRTPPPLPMKDAKPAAHAPQEFMVAPPTIPLSAPPRAAVSQALKSPLAEPSKPRVSALPIAPPAAPPVVVMPAALAPTAMPPAAVSPVELSDANERSVAVMEPPAENAAEELSDANLAEASARWRVPRLHFSTRVQVNFPGEAKARECTTINIGASSALLQLPQKIAIGQSLLLTNPTSREQIACQVRYVKEQSPQLFQAGVEFVKEAKKFWGVTFPPEDWHPSERKRPPKRA